MNKRDWDKIRRFEDEYNRKHLRRMSAAESFKVFARLYELGSRLAGKRYLNSVDRDHVSSILAVKSKLKALSR